MLSSSKYLQNALLQYLLIGEDTSRIISVRICRKSDEKFDNGEAKASLPKGW
jgi:hypothetical protein